MIQKKKIFNRFTSTTKNGQFLQSGETSLSHFFPPCCSMALEKAPPAEPPSKDDSIEEGEIQKCLLTVLRECLPWSEDHLKLNPGDDVEMLEFVDAVWAKGKRDVDATCGLFPRFSVIEFEKIKSLADSGDCAAAELELYVRYSSGQGGVEQDAQEAEKWLARAINKGDSVALVIQSLKHLVNENNEEAIRFAEKAASNGWNIADGLLVKIYTQQNMLDEALKWVMKGAKNGNISAMLETAALLERMNRKDEAFTWYMKSAELGSALGQTCVGACYFHGTGVARDLKACFSWTMKAALQGNAQAMELIGRSYEAGHSCARDVDEACVWFERAAAKGNVSAMLSVARLSRDVKKAIRWSKMAIKEGELKGYAFLIHVNMQRFDAVKAIKWANRGAAAGDQLSASMLETLLLAGPAPPPTLYPAEVLGWFWEKATSLYQEGKTAELARLLLALGAYWSPR